MRWAVPATFEYNHHWVLTWTSEKPEGTGDDGTSCAYDVAGLSAYAEEHGFAQIEELYRLY